MFSNLRKVLSVVGVTAAVAAGMSLGGGTALAAPPKCTAALKSGWGCLAVNNKTRNPKVYSIRIDDTCIPGLVPGKTRYATGYAIEAKFGTHRWMYYTGSSCEGGTGSAIYGTLSGWSDVDKDKYVTVTMIDSP